MSGLSKRLIVNDASNNRGRVFAYCHDSVGIGHLVRTLTICGRIGEAYPFSTFLIATGTPYVPLFTQLPRVDYIKLPALAKEGKESYCSKFLSVSIDQLIEWRKSVLLNTVQQYNPDIVLVDKAPLGVCNEFVPALRWLRRYRPRTKLIFGMRDIEDAPEATIDEWGRGGVVDILEECFDEIWVYGMRDIFDVVHEYGLTAAIQSKLRFMGYVAQEPCTHLTSTNGCDKNVLVTVGGGTDGEFLLSTYLEEAAGRMSTMGISSTIVGGPDLPSSVRTSLRERASAMELVTWIDFNSCLCCDMKNAAAVVSMGGYNTLCQVARARKPALVVPRVQPRLEQSIRAALWSQQGVVSVAAPDGLTPSGLADRICELLESPHSAATSALDLHGLDRICARFDSFWQTEPHRATALRM